MRLASFTVENYRSITNARKIKLEDYTVLIGPNNEGKSNILNALNLGMEAIRLYQPVTIKGSGDSTFDIPPNGNRAMESYDWKRDFPINLQARYPQSSTLIGLDFELTENERLEFRRIIGASISTFLPLKLRFGNRFSLNVSKQGPGQKALNKKVGQICKFVYDRVRFDYIPAIRTAGQASSLIARLIERELKAFESDDEYQQALKKIENLERPVLEALSASVTSTVRSFLPGVSNVKIEAKKDPYRSTRRDVEITVDDGVATNIARKGDGVQSLVALAIMRHIAHQQKGSAFSIVAIEEPESHLHPQAARELRQVIIELSSSNQVVLSSHSPLFVRTNKTESNIIVKNRRALPAKLMQEVRECLGVRLSDNLQSANLILLVEGKTDRVALESIVSFQSRALNEALRDGRLAIEALGGGTKLANKASFYQLSACSIHCFLDHDETGLAAIRDAKERRYITDVDYQLAKDPGRPKSEFEDLLDMKLYEAAIKDKFGVNVFDRVEKKGKWSERIGAIFAANGKDWDGSEVEVKPLVAECVAANPSNAIHPKKFGPIQALIDSLENKLG